LDVLAAEGHGWLQDVRQGWWSPAYGRKEPLSVLHFSTTAALPAEFVTLFRPIERVQVQDCARLAQIEGSSALGVRGYRYATMEEEHCLFFGQGKKWKLDQWSSDAEFLYWGRNRNGKGLLICCNSSHLEAGGQRILSSPKIIVKCEVIAKGGHAKVLSSDKDAALPLEALPATAEPAMT